MNGERTLLLPTQRRHLVADALGCVIWQTEAATAVVPAARTALVLCDIWDRHWCRGANERLRLLLPGLQQLVEAVREAGVLVVHAPSDTMPFYAGTPARQRVLDAPFVTPPTIVDHDEVALPFDTPNGGCDAPGDQEHRVWSRQHPAIRIDHERDAISDSGQELYNLYSRRTISTIVIVGVHTNMCILNRSFAIRAMVRWGFDVFLVRDLTDAMYNPADPPYVSHEQGTCLVVAYIEKFWCPTLTSTAMVGAVRG